MGRRRRESPQTLRPVRFGVYLDRATHHRLLRAALAANMSATELVERLIKEHLGRRR